MGTDIGELVAGAYLECIEQCDIVHYNYRPPGTGLKGMAEIDVLGLHFERQTVLMCEVATHLRGLNYGSGNAVTVQKIRDKLDRNMNCARYFESTFPIVRHMLWSPNVPTGALTKQLADLGMELVI